MSTLTIDNYEMPAARLGPDNPLVPLSSKPADVANRSDLDENNPEEERRYVNYGAVEGHLPYLVQGDYDRERRKRSFRVAVLENEVLRAIFLLDFGGRLWSLFHKGDRRELLYLNPVFQPVNFAIRNAWFSGGVE